MTAERAVCYIEDIQRFLTHHRNAFSADMITANSMAISALEKQIPKRKTLRPLNGGMLHVRCCPTCYETIEDRYQSYCDNCGQKLEVEE